jgi:lipopolysaccharide transport system ATP-binding protein
MSDSPAFLHVSHAKAGSTWVDQILRVLFGKRVASRVGRDLSGFRFEPGRIYSAAFLRRDQVLAHPELSALPRFIVIRDLRDTVVSRYFSVKISHGLDASGVIAEQRRVLNGLSTEDGLAWIIENGVSGIAAIQRSWLGQDERLYRYEELIRDDVALFRRILLDELRLPLDPSRLDEAVIANRFENVYQRPMGVADPASHGRQGAPGDWRNHFTPRLRAAFHARFGDVLVATGYEPDGTWVEAGR